MNSTQLIEFFNLRKSALGEKATDFNMFLEGYSAALNDMDIKNHYIQKACEALYGLMNDLGCDLIDIEEAK